MVIGERKRRVFSYKDPRCMVIGFINYISKNLCLFLSNMTQGESLLSDATMAVDDVGMLQQGTNEIEIRSVE